MADSSRPQTLAGLHALEWRYDGPIPPAALAALAATPAALAARMAAADGALLDRLARESVRRQAVARLAALRTDRPAGRGEFRRPA